MPPIPNISELPLTLKPITILKPPSQAMSFKSQLSFSSLTLCLSLSKEVRVWKGAGKIQQTAPVVNTVFPRLMLLQQSHGRLASLPGL